MPMNKKLRQYLGLLSAVIAYYLIHEGAHLLYALASGVFKEIHVMGLGIQIDVHAQRMTDSQLGIFCLVGAAATFLTAWGLVLTAPWICRWKSRVGRAIVYDITLAMLFADPVYLGLLAPFVGGGDLNGIAYLVPRPMAQGIFIGLLLLHGFIFWKILLPQYQKSFQNTH